MIDFTKYLYESLPAIYRLEDIHQSYTLKRYLDVLGDYMNFVCNETENIMDLYDVDKMPVNFLKRYASLFDFPLYEDMPEALQRRLLSNLVPILRRKGTREVIEFVAREVTGCDINVIEGDSRAFATWSDPLDLPVGYNVPLTFELTQTMPYKYCGDIDTNRFTMYVSIIADIVGGMLTEKELREKETVLRNYLKDLIPSYLNLVFLVTAREEVDDVFEEETTMIVDEQLTKNDIVDYERTFGRVSYTITDTGLDLYNAEIVKMDVDSTYSDLLIEIYETSELALIVSKEEFIGDTPIGDSPPTHDTDEITILAEYKDEDTMVIKEDDTIITLGTIDIEYKDTQSEVTE
nr:MAG TPA: tail protein [Caudoviricetes sp.]